MHHLDADPDFVRSQAAAITTAASDIQDATRTLYGLGYGEFQSQAVDAFQTNVRQLARVLDDAWTRYADTGDALSAYEPVLRRVQQEIDAAIGMVSHTDVNGAMYKAEDADFHAVTQSLNPLASDSDRDEAKLAAAHAKAHLEQQLAAVATAEANYESALADLHRAAAAAAAQIENGIEMSHLNDSFWDHFQQLMDNVHEFFRKTLEILHDVLSAISDLLSVVGLVVAIIGVVTLQPEIAGLGVLILGASDVVGAIDTGVQVLRFLDGDVTFGTMMSAVLITVAGLLISKVGAKLGAKVGAALGEEVVSKLFSKGMQKVDGEIAEHAFGKALDLTKDPLGDFIDEHVHIPDSVTKYLAEGQWEVPYTSTDVDQLTPDFSDINVQKILDSAMSSAPSSSPILATACVSTGVA